MSFADIIYKTPDEWGEPVYANEWKMLEIVANFKGVLDGPVSLSECSKYGLRRTIDDNQALYASPVYTQDGRHVFPVSVFARSGGGEYEFVEEFKSESDFWQEYDARQASRADKSQEDHISDLLEVTEAALEWIDAVPQDASLPAMPGFDRYWAEEVRRAAKEYLEQNVDLGHSPGQ